MKKMTGSWVAIPTPFDADSKVNFGAFKELIDFHTQYRTDLLFCMGSAGEVSMLSPEERVQILSEVIKVSKGKIPVYFGATMPTTESTLEFAAFAQAEGADGLVLSAPAYLIPSHAALLEFMLTVIKSVQIPVSIYTNPGRTGVMLSPGEIKFLAEECPNFVADKEASGDMERLYEVSRLVGDKISIMGVETPKLANLVPSLALGAMGICSALGNIIPEETSIICQPWDSMEQAKKCKEMLFMYDPLIKALYTQTSPVCIKAAMRMLGLPVGMLRKPYLELEGSELENLRNVMTEFGVFKKYKVN